MKKKKDNKKSILLASFMVLAVLLILLTININKNKNIAFYVNNEPIYEEELLNSVNSLSSSIRNELMREYNIKSEDFSWDKNVENGKKAIEFLKEEAINKSTYEKVLQIEARENDLIEKIDYNSIKKELENENKIRKENKNNNKIVYGVTQFQFSEYYQYMNNNLSIQLKQKLIDNGHLNITDKELKSVYENNKEMFQAENKESGKLEPVPFKDVKSSVIDLGLSEKFNQYMKEEVKVASIKINNEGRLDDLVEKSFT